VLKKWSLGGLGLIFWCLPALAQREELLVSTACEGWPAETVSRVEARIRATFLAESLSARRVHISCDPSGNASISLEGGEARPVARQSPRLEDDVVAAVEVALRELQASNPEPVPEERPPSPTAATSGPPTVAFQPVPALPLTPVEPGAAPPPSPGVVPRDTAPPAPAEGRESRARVAPELGVTPLVELWSSHWALGAEGGLSVGDQFQYGLSVGGAAAAGEPDTFDISEWHGNLRLAWTFPGDSGLRVILAAGASLLVTAPDQSVVASSNQALGAASLGLHLSRPFWFGSFGTAPTLGARFFSGRRNVRVDENEELVVPVFSPQAGLWLLYRQE
jgi:hypothetical protein